MNLQRLMQANPRLDIQSRSTFAAAIVQAITGAAVEGRRELIWVDVDYSSWPLEDPQVLDALSRWARQPMRKLLMLAHHFNDVAIRQPRFTRWRRTYAHRIECRSAPALAPSEFPCLMLAGDLYSLHVSDTTRWRGRWLDDDNEHKTWRDVVDAVVQRSEIDFASNTLGL